MKSRLLIMLIAAAALLSCTSTKDNSLAYFKDLDAQVSGSLPNPQGNYPIQIQPDDELVITVTSTVPEATAAYNLPMDNPATRGNLRTQTQPRSQTYIVDDQGYIMMPILGRIMVKDKTTSEISEEITAMVAQNVKDPYVRVDIVNFSVDVLGEVRVPQRVYSGRQHFTVLDALAQCGDLTEFGQRDRVYVIRTENGKREYHRLNLNNSEVFNSPYFYLRQNDVVYVEPNKIRVDNSKYNQNNAFKLSVISTVVSSVSVIASLIIALAR
ncbi:MAG: polysaccharide biosynthesis/export family protein [Muribaculaceae bacterium]|nr:polysaccharide biosynthesis/export family protein [Muribaculaceae bacterium]MBR5685983.1 polysaccharide biosynthesis/export family protein [Muribaculaceae bacterium]